MLHSLFKIHLKSLHIAGTLFFLLNTSLAYSVNCGSGNIRIFYNNAIVTRAIRINDLPVGVGATSYEQPAVDLGSQALAGGSMSFSAGMTTTPIINGLATTTNRPNRFNRGTLWRLQFRNGVWDPTWDPEDFTTVITQGGGPDNQITLTGDNGGEIIASVLYPADRLRVTGDPTVAGGVTRIRVGVEFNYDVSGAVEGGQYTAIGATLTVTNNGNAPYLDGCP
jgi:hypothetical protein